MKKLLIMISLIGLFIFFTPAFADDSSSCSENCPNDEFSDIEKPKFYKIIDPDIHIDFSNSDHWEGLDTSSDYWKIKNGEGHFFLHSKQQQLGSATFDLLPLLESDIGEDWILRYKLQIDNYQQTTSSKWSELLIGLFSESVNGLNPQWGVGVGFLNGAKLTYTNLMYDFGTYNNWHCCPMKGQFTDEDSLLKEQKTLWVEYVKDDNTLTVRLFEDNDFKKLIEQKSVSGWEIDGLRFLKIFPLVEDNSVNGYISGRIDDVKFYNDETSVYQPDKKPVPETLTPKTLEEVMKEVYGSDYEEPTPEKTHSAPIPEWFKKTVSLWANDNLTDDEFYSSVKHLVINERILIDELSQAYNGKLNLTYKPKTVIIPVDIKCQSCILEEFVNLTWKLPDGLPRNAQAAVEIINPDGVVSKYTANSKTNLTLRITSEFIPGLYHISVSYGNEVFSVSPLMLTNEDIPKIPFWIKYNSGKWSKGELHDQEFVDSIIFLIQNGKITFDYEIFHKKETRSELTPKEKLEKFFPTQDEINGISPELPPPLWEYLVTSDALSLVNMEYTSVQKILEDKSRNFDPIHNKHDVPFTLIQIYQFDSNDVAKDFIEEQIWVNNVLIKGTITDDDLAYDDYQYNKIFETSDLSGTSEKTGDCLYYMSTNTGSLIMDDTHFLQCLLDDKIIQIYLYEDYPVVDKNFTFDLMDIILQKINKTTDIESIKNILSLNNIPGASPSNSSPSNSSPSNSSPSNSSPSNSSPKLDEHDPELSGIDVGVSNFQCKKDDFGTITMSGEFVNAAESFEKVKIDISIESYDGTILAFGSDYVLKINPYETRDLDAYVFVDKPFHNCHATVDWENSS